MLLTLIKMPAVQVSGLEGLVHGKQKEIETYSVTDLGSKNKQRLVYLLG